MGFFNKLFSKKRSASAMAMQEPKFMQTLKRGIATYEVYQHENAEIAKQWLLSKKIKKPNYHFFILTPDGNWGLDIKGLYLEALRSYQLDIASADCVGKFLRCPSEFSFEIHIQGTTDNFIGEIGCGECNHKWLDGVRVSKITVVQCPNCMKKNKIDLTHLTASVRSF